MIRKSPGLAALLLGAYSIGNLTFTRTTDHAVVAKTTVANGASYLPASVDLGGARATCLDDLTAGLSVAALAATRIIAQRELASSIIAIERAATLTASAAAEW